MGGGSVWMLSYVEGHSKFKAFTKVWFGYCIGCLVHAIETASF